MKLDVGYTVYSLDGASFLYGFSSLIDYDPNSSDLDDAVGEHFKIYKTSNNSHLLFYKVRGQESLGSPAFTASEGIIPISNDLAFLLMNRDTRDVSINDTKKHYDALITDLTAWLVEIEPKIDAVFELSQDFKNDLNEMLVCLNANAFRSCLAMAGIVLERLLKNFLTVKNIPHPKNSMVGNLISQIEYQAFPVAS
jgi:hypothetical protein